MHPVRLDSCIRAAQRPAPSQQLPQRHERRRRQERRQRAAVGCRAEHQRSPRVLLYDAFDQLVPYEEAWRWQKELVDQVAAWAPSKASSSSSGAGSSSERAGSSNGSSSAGGSASSSSASPLGALLLLQHPPVYTLGAGATEEHLRFDPAAPPLPLYRTERGGEVTYHGPGQLVMYPILDLRSPPLQPDLHWYLRGLEEVVIRALDAVSGLRGERIPGLTGVWVGGQKVAAMGVRASRWVTYHGLALNVVSDLAPFRQIVPCGIADRPVASVAGLLVAAAGEAAAAAQRGGGGGGAAVAAEGWEEDPFAAGFGGGEGPALGVAAGLASAAGAAAAEAAAAAAAAESDSPAALPGAEVASELSRLAERPAVPREAAERALLEEYRHALLEAFEEVFGVQLEAAPLEGWANGGGAGQADGRPPAAAAGTVGDSGTMSAETAA